ncbi:hypothetical protein VE25_05705 [Devosia geojensis]|uniref:Superoxide dismutase [Cu-Zn] n=1 Tax=Devosia geojensis TaxID=443610 RepID=A0A0F5FX29_9HYPH|nr:superoxide dismutase family protein [Devosia geojensis]KKB12727.1 hypothetical protein VE25_05705 [Devosia geojensis]
MKTTILTLASLALLTGAATAQDTNPGATANFVDVEGNEIGAVTLLQTPEGVNITGALEMGVPEGEHGFHIHETGDCDPADAFESAGDHFDVADHQHGFDNPEGPHAGDIHNIIADADGRAVVEVTNDMVSLVEGEDGYLFDDNGSALVVHADPDDYVTDPSGNSGDRIACAVIEAAPN